MVFGSWFPILHRIEICEDGYHPFAEANGCSALHVRQHFRHKVPGQAVPHRARGLHVLLRKFAFINPGEDLRSADQISWKPMELLKCDSEDLIGIDHGM